MFIVIPHLTKQPSVYGFYVLCISSTIFLNYADLGFLSSCQKYAAESFALNKNSDEIKYLGFGAFILSIVVLFISIIFIFFSVFPNTIIKNFDNLSELYIAKKMFILLAIFAPLTILTRISNAIFEIRIESFIPQRINILQSLLSIISVFYFFRKNHFEIINYYIFTSCLSIASIIIIFFIIKKRYSYNITQLFRNFTFNKLIYIKTKRLAFSGLYVLIVWILFNEIDQFMIAKLLGMNKVAFFAIALSISMLFRTIFSFFFSPFSSRANYYVADGNEEGLSHFLLESILISLPFIFIPCITFFFYIKEFIISWVGENYISSIPSARLMSLVYSLSFIGFPIGIYLVAKEKIHEMYLIATLQAILYWSGIFLTYNKLDIYAFSFFKILTIYLSDIYYIYILMKYFKLSFQFVIENIIKPIVFFLILVYAQYLLYSNFLDLHNKDRISLLIVTIIMFFTIATTIIIYYFLNKKYRNKIKYIISSLN